MKEGLQENNIENRKNIDFSTFSFDELQDSYRKILELGRNSFKRNEYGFANVEGEGIAFEERNGKYSIVSISKKLQKLHYIAISENLLSRNNFHSEEEILKVLKEMIEKTGGRIIE